VAAVASILIGCAAGTGAELPSGGTGGAAAGGAGTGGAATGGEAAATGGAATGGTAPDTGGTTAAPATGGAASGCPFVHDCDGQPDCSTAIGGDCGACKIGVYACGDHQGWFTTDGLEFACVAVASGSDCTAASTDAQAHCTACSAGL
jgi:hypothetical protein